MDFSNKSSEDDHATSIKEFVVDEKYIFRGRYECFLNEMTENGVEVVLIKWTKIKDIKNTNLLKALRDQAAHACDSYPDVSKDFEKDF